jgi:O-antigen ligase
MTRITVAGRASARFDFPAVAAWGFAFALVSYLALQDGGYDVVARSQIGIVVWWIVLLGAIVGAAPRRIGIPGWVAIALLAAFAAWTGFSIDHSESAEGAAIELNRVATYLGVLVLALWIVPKSAARHTINGVACAVALVTILAVLSRLHPRWFPANDHIEFLPAAAGELSYPLSFWNLLAGFIVLGMPLLLAIALAGRTVAGRAAAAAMLPLGILCLYLTSSRGGVAALAAGIGAMLALTRRRCALLASLGVAGAGGAILVVAAGERDALKSGLSTAAAHAQGDELTYLVIVVVVGVALAQTALIRAARHIRTPRLSVPSPRSLIVGALIATVVAVAAGVPGELEERGRQIARLPAPTAVGQDGGGGLRDGPRDIRYQFWEASLDAFERHPLRGIGAGSFEFWWARVGSDEGLFRDAHSLYFESLAELGLVGFVLIAGLMLWLIGQAVVRTLRSPAEPRMWLAAATGALVAFAVTAAVEWAWEMAVLPVAAMLLSAVVLASCNEGARARGTAGADARLGIAAFAVVALIAIALPLASIVALEDSRVSARAGRLDEAVQDALTAERLQPHAAMAKLQRALVLEQLGRLDAAAVAARMASEDEPTNWRPWLVRARLDARRGRARSAVRELRRARNLNPRFTGFRHP